MYSNRTSCSLIILIAKLILLLLLFIEMINFFVKRGILITKVSIKELSVMGVLEKKMRCSLVTIGIRLLHTKVVLIIVQ